MPDLTLHLLQMRQSQNLLPMVDDAKPDLGKSNGRPVAAGRHSRENPPRVILLEIRVMQW
jgi:hypothetical protein